jgi:purine-binding chemotaxis protein CheW
VSARSARRAAAGRLDPGARRRLLVLRLADREYGLDAGAVVQVLRMVAIRPVPEAPAWIAGVVNLRGRTTPMMDLRTRLGLPTRPPGLSDHIVIVQAGEAALGLMVDAALEVLEVDEDAIEAPGEAAGRSGVIAAVARSGERLLLVLDVERLSVDAVQVPAGPVGAGEGPPRWPASGTWSGSGSGCRSRRRAGPTWSGRWPRWSPRPACPTPGRWPGCWPGPDDPTRPSTPSCRP